LGCFIGRNPIKSNIKYNLTICEITNNWTKAVTVIIEEDVIQQVE